jgi:hypothetical protein
MNRPVMTDDLLGCLAVLAAMALAGIMGAFIINMIFG